MSCCILIHSYSSLRIETDFSKLCYLQSLHHLLGDKNDLLEALKFSNWMITLSWRKSLVPMIYMLDTVWAYWQPVKPAVIKSSCLVSTRTRTKHTGSQMTVLSLSWNCHGCRHLCDFLKEQGKDWDGFHGRCSVFYACEMCCDGSERKSDSLQYDV